MTTEHDRTLEGFYQWEPAIEVTAECLSTVFPTQINGTDVHICMPLFADDGSFLSEPQMLYKRPPSYHNVDPDNAWGEWKSWNNEPDGKQVPVTVNVRRVRVATNISDDADPHQAALQLDEHLLGWWLNVRAWIEVLTGQDLSMLGDRRQLGPNIFHFWVGTDDGFMSPLPFLIPVPIPPQARALTAYGFNLCLEKTAANEAPPTEWLFYRDAWSLHQAHEWRRAVLDASTAAEIAITAWLDNHAPAQVLTDLAAHPKTLRPLSTLFQNHGGALPDNFGDLVVDPRNHAAHRGRALSEAESRSAIETVKALLDATTPLPT